MTLDPGVVIGGPGAGQLTDGPSGTEVRGSTPAVHEVDSDGPGEWQFNLVLAFAICVVLNAALGLIGGFPILLTYELLNAYGGEFGLGPPMTENPDVSLRFYVFIVTIAWLCFLTTWIPLNWMLRLSSTVRTRCYWPVAMGVATFASLAWIDVLFMALA